MELPERARDADAVRLFRFAVANEDHAHVQQAKLDHRDASALFVAGSVEPWPATCRASATSPRPTAPTVTASSPQAIRPSPTESEAARDHHPAGFP
ncbi:hypothetical protein GCM10027563_25560 [Parasphingorhabdus pacifica]